MNEKDRKIREKIISRISEGKIQEANALLEAWQDMDTNDITGGHTRTIYCNYGSGRSDR